MTVETQDTDGMDEAVRAAADLAQPGDTVLLAPAAASMDMFRDYAERGDRFAAAAPAVAGPMSSATRERAGRAGPRRGRRRRRAPSRRSLALLDRPLASYYLVIGTAALLLALGLIMVLSASSVTSFASSGSSFTIAERQGIWMAIGLPALWIGSRLPVRAYRLLGYPLLLASFALLLLVLVPGVGQNVSGATRWIDLPGGLQIQPSEPAKLALVLWGADLLARKEKRLGETKHLLVPLVPVALLMALLVMAEPDMGTTIVLITVMLALLFTAGARLGVFARIGVVPRRRARRRSR